MKKTLARKKGQMQQQQLSSEYRFDYNKSKPNRFAARMSSGGIAVLLDSAEPQSKRKREH